MASGSFPIPLRERTAVRPWCWTPIAQVPTWLSSSHPWRIHSSAAQDASLPHKPAQDATRHTPNTVEHHRRARIQATHFKSYSLFTEVQMKHAHKCKLYSHASMWKCLLLKTDVAAETRVCWKGQCVHMSVCDTWVPQKIAPPKQLFVQQNL